MEATLYETLRDGDSQVAQLLAAKAEIAAYILEHIDDPAIEKIACWEGERITSTFDEAGYCERCAIVYRYATTTEPECSKLHELFGFVSDAVKIAYEHWKIRLRRADGEVKLRRAQQLEAEAAQLRKEACETPT